MKRALTIVAAIAAALLCSSHQQPYTGAGDPGAPGIGWEQYLGQPGGYGGSYVWGNPNDGTGYAGFGQVGEYLIVDHRVLAGCGSWFLVSKQPLPPVWTAVGWLAIDLQDLVMAHYLPPDAAWVEPFGTFFYRRGFHIGADVAPGTELFVQAFAVTPNGGLIASNAARATFQEPIDG